MTILSFADLNIAGQCVAIREDLNVPLKDGVITSDARIQAALPTIRMALAKGAGVILLSHLGRPQEGEPSAELSLQPVAERLTQLLAQPVRLIKDWRQGVEVKPGEVVLCENVRFETGEKKNSPELAKQIAALADVYVMDAFGTAHRAEASTEGAIHYAKIACAGPLLMTELNAIQQAIANPKRPLLAIVGGSKVSTKLLLLQSICAIADSVLVGGGILNTFMAAAGLPIGKSLYEADLVAEAKNIQTAMRARGAEIPLPVDVVVADRFAVDAQATVKVVQDVSADDMILDIGPKTAQAWAERIQQAATIVWNGPVGVFEFPAFAKGTEVLAHAIANSAAFSLAGGGDTLAAIEQFGVLDKISYISTGGGAFLECLEGKTLPAVAALETRKL